MNNTNTFIYFLLYVQHKSQPGSGQIPSTLSAWMVHFRHRLSPARFRLSDAEKPTIPDLEPEKNPKARGNPQRVARQNSWIKTAFRRITMVLGSLHLSLMAGLGIWLWSDPRSFGPKGCLVDTASIVVVGRGVPLGSAGLRGWSLGIYSLFLIPGLNLILPMALFLGLFLGYQTWNSNRMSNTAELATTAALPANFVRLRIPTAIHAWYNNLPAAPSVFPTIVGMGLLFTTNLIFVVDIELTLWRNRPHQDPGESNWTFGQILAIILLALPLRDLAETVLARRETQRKEELAKREQQRRDEHTASLRNTIQQKASMKIILDLIENGVDVNMKVEESEYSTPLILAASRADADSVTALLAYGADPNIRGVNDRSALQTACATNDRDSHNIVKILLESGADPNASGERAPAIYARPWDWSFHEIVQLLLEHGADPDISSEVCKQGFYAACKDRQPNVARLLLERGADPNTHGPDGSALYVAVASYAYDPHSETVKVLLDHGADPNTTDGELGAPLHFACIKGHTEIAKLLLDRGADVNIQGGYYCTPLQGAAYEEHEFQIDMITLLLANGADVNIQGGQYCTALQAAAYRNRLDIVEILLANDAEVNIEGGAFCTALQAASRSHSVEIVKLLLSRGAAVNTQGTDGCTALHQASFWGGTGVVKLLLESGADTRIQDDWHGTPLHAAADATKLDNIKLLLDYGADVNAQAKCGGTALQEASLTRCSRERATDAVKVLLASGADVNVQGGDYDTALQAAAYGANLAVVELLLANGADVNFQGGEYGNALRAAVLRAQDRSSAEGLLVTKVVLEHGADPNLGGHSVLEEVTWSSMLQVFRSCGYHPNSLAQ
ncbi:ankyrin repeat-containing domain protein [Mycena polygramma]|nr:ankyrin repeat-containing domain protein [Mycena polygramma]